MKLSVRSEYGLRALLALASHPRETWLSVQSIASAQNLPRRFLEQILHDLRQAGLVESRRGVAGGYRLAQPPEQVSLSRVIRHFDGPLSPIGCVDSPSNIPCSCPDPERCPLRSVMGQVRDAMASLLDTMTVADLHERGLQLLQNPRRVVDFTI